MTGGNGCKALRDSHEMPHIKACIRVTDPKCFILGGVSISLPEFPGILPIYILHKYKINVEENMRKKEKDRSS